MAEEMVVFVQPVRDENASSSSCRWERFMVNISRPILRHKTQQRASCCLFTRRAAFHLQQTLTEDSEDDRRGLKSGSSRQSLNYLLGGMGATLFDPLQEGSIRSHSPIMYEVYTDSTLAFSFSLSLPSISGSNEEKAMNHACGGEGDEEESYGFSVVIDPEDEATLKLNPRLLTETMMHQLLDEGLPITRKIDSWKRVFSIGCDGDGMGTMLHKCKDHKYTVLVVKTMSGHLLGGFATECWNQLLKPGKGNFYGTGQSFLFASHPDVVPGLDPPRDPTKELMIFPWTGNDDYCQLCSTRDNKIAMGGQDGFGIILSDNFFVGCTSRCGTFGNPPLIPNSENGRFDVASFEIYGLVPLSESFCTGV